MSCIVQMLNNNNFTLHCKNVGCLRMSCIVQVLNDNFTLLCKHGGCVRMSCIVQVLNNNNFTHYIASMDQNRTAFQTSVTLYNSVNILFKNLL